MSGASARLGRGGAPPRNAPRRAAGMGLTRARRAGMVLLAILGGCVPEADESALPPILRVPEVPDVTRAATGGDSRVFEMNTGGGRAGAPFGLAFILPRGTAATATAGPLDGGGTGFRLEVAAPGDALVCTEPMKVAGGLTVEARQRVHALRGATKPWHGAHAELRARTGTGALVEIPGTRYLPVHTVRAPGGWETWTFHATLPAAARNAELCWRLVGTTGTLEVDRASVVSDGVPLPDTPPVVATRWEFDRTDPSGVPEGFAFVLPPGTRGATLAARDGVLHVATTLPGNALACSQAIRVAPGMVFQGRYRVTALEADARPWTGAVVEVRAYDMIGGLASPSGAAFTTLQTWRAPTDGWQHFDVAFDPPPGAVTGKLCVRFVYATGALDLDWAGVAEP